MVCTQVMGNINDPSYEIVLRRRLGGAFAVDELLLDGGQCHQAKLCAVSTGGVTVEVRLGGAAEPLRDGDVLGVVDAPGAAMPVVAVVRLRSAEVLAVTVPRSDAQALARVCWEVGNLHAALFAGEETDAAICLLTPATPIMERLLLAIDGVHVERREDDLSRYRRFASGAAQATVGFAADFKIVRKG